MTAVLTQDTVVRVIQDLRSEKVRLIAPLYVVIEEADGIIVASNDDLDLFGYGETEAEALQDLRQVIEETFFDLQRDQAQLGPHLQAVWNYLNRIILEVRLHAA
jgi:predicted RNase H-like HicB family nuclease